MVKNKVSIIIPVYNAEKFIGKCTDSILNQTYKNIELILVNDGSKDNSLQVINSIAQKDNRVKIIDKPNGGAASARNRGLEEVTGEYLFFVDSDDWLENDYIEQYMSNVQNDEYDMIIGGYKKILIDKEIMRVKLLNKRFSKYIVGGPWCHLFKTDFVKKNKIDFSSINIGEDTYFITKCFDCGARVKCIEYVGYNYYFNDNSLTNVQFKQLTDKLDIIKLIDLMNLKNVEDIECQQYFVVRYVVAHLLWGGKVSSADKMIEFTKKYFDYLDKVMPEYKNNKFVNWIAPSGEIKKNGFAVRIYVFLYKTNLYRLFAKIYCKGE